MPPQLFNFGPFVFDCGRRTLLQNGSPVAIGERGRALLQALLEANGEVVTKSALMDAAWPKTNIEESNLTVQIAALRKLLGQSAKGEEWIATVPRVGYRLVRSTPFRHRDIDTVVDAESSPAIDAKPSIAVLPFVNMSSDPEQEYFGDGLAEDLITDLSKVPGLLVIARHSSFAYKDKPSDICSIARDLGVRYVIEGSVRRAADRVRISAQIIDAQDNSHLWAERFDRALADFFALQDEVVSRIVSALAAVLPSTATAPRRRTTNLEAYDLFVRGRVVTMQSPNALKEARSLLAKAIDLDPNFPEAYAWLAMNYWVGYAHTEEEVEPARALALSAARKAASLDPEDAAAHMILGWVHLYGGDWHESGSEFETALRINPNHADTWALLSDRMVFEGRATEAIEGVQKAIRLNPYPPGWYYWCLGFAQYAAGQYTEAVETLRREETHRSPSQRILAASLAQLGCMDEAREEAQHIVKANPHFSVQRWSSTQPFRDHFMREHFVNGLIKSGLPP